MEWFHDYLPTEQYCVSSSGEDQEKSTREASSGEESRGIEEEEQQ
jgi:hypothetical protein